MISTRSMPLATILWAGARGASYALGTRSPCRWRRWTRSKSRWTFGWPKVSSNGPSGRPGQGPVAPNREEAGGGIKIRITSKIKSAREGQKIFQKLVATRFVAVIFGAPFPRRWKGQHIRGADN